MTRNALAKKPGTPASAGRNVGQMRANGGATNANRGREVGTVVARSPFWGRQARTSTANRHIGATTGNGFPATCLHRVGPSKKGMVVRMDEISRNHHFVSAFYFAGFTDTGTKRGDLYVFDVRNNRVFPEKPKNIACELDFNLVTVDGQSSDVVERGFAKFESTAALVIRQIRDESVAG